MQPEDQPPIGNPEPMLREELGRILTRLMSVFVVIATGIAAFGLFLVPTRTSGATRSGKLQMQERQREVTQAASPVDTPAPSSLENSQTATH
jgi:hypothetical protein